MNQRLYKNKVWLILLFGCALYTTITGHTDDSSFIASLIIWVVLYNLFPFIFSNFGKNEKIFKITAIVIISLWILIGPVADMA